MPSRQTVMKKLIFIALAVALPCCVAAFASPSEVTLFGWPALLVLAVGAYCLQWLAFIPARLAETERFYDLTGSLTYVVITLSAVVVSPASTWPQWLVAALVIIWAGATRPFFYSNGFIRRVAINALITSRYLLLVFWWRGRYRALGW